jgi:hypothetical protein
VLLSASQPIWSLPAEAVPAALQSTPEGLSLRRRALPLILLAPLLVMVADDLRKRRLAASPGV